ncbi:hypothetical protein BRADI_5g10840v3 [Brachypodium distachyon]|uniref:GRF-type domain-containing protein n=1 Tax=Brachypodium distachyon TaxID=15368 RepID=I1IY05_BRADI|nr:hypothetical protein BRADI_5g10840v3 [Brachypodium distachyon]
MVSWPNNSIDPGSMQLDGIERPPPRPKVLDDPEFKGFGITEDVGCHHGLFARRTVSYEGTNIGRRFFACGAPEEQGGDCGFREWVDPEWPPIMKRSLAQLWGERIEKYRLIRLWSKRRTCV